MTCFAPLKGWRAHTVNASGKRPIVFERSAAFTDMPMEIPCGQCIGCRLEYSRQWAIRCAHEAQLHEENSFITLTYSDDHLPDDLSLHLGDFQKFMKRLRKSLSQKIRFYHCGEYGEIHGRPHYHACIFGHSFPDKTPWKIINEETLYRSASLEKLWPYGYSSVGNVTFRSAAYVARYILKKITGDNAEAHYEYVNPLTGEITQKTPEYTTMSRRPGLGTGWFKRFHDDVYPSDEIIINGKSMRPPKFYDGLYEIETPEEYKKTKRQRKAKALIHSDDQTPERLKVRCQVQKSQLNLLPRKVE
jgi:hypothetical protein